MNDEDYHKLQAGGSAWTHLSPQYRQRLFEAIDSLGDVKGKSVIDVGCGDGESVQYLLDKGVDTKQSFGIEYSMDKVNYAREKGLPVHCADLDKMSRVDHKAIRSADIIFCSHTLEHVRDAVACARILCEMSREKLLIIVPHEEEFPTANPSHTSWMSNERIQKVKEVLEEYFTTVKEERKHRLEDEVWLIAEGRKV